MLFRCVFLACFVTTMTGCVSQYGGGWSTQGMTETEAQTQVELQIERLAR